MSDAAPIGHNNPPSPLEPIPLINRFTEQYAGLTARTAELVKAMEAFTEQYAGGLDAVGSAAAADNLDMLRKQIKRIDDDRKDEKEPYLAITKVLDGWFNAQRDKLQPLADQLDKLMTAYLDAGQSSMGVYGTTAKVVEAFDFEITDPKKVERKYCSPDPKLIRPAIKAGLRQAKGMTISPANKTRTR